ncbi:MAG: galactose mutarotase [Acidimicrobiia bacterium]|nr:galactose mutarotase [Acidimicrobiia bacterium]
MAHVAVELLGQTTGHRGQAPRHASAYRLHAGTLGVTVWDYGAHLIEVVAPDRDGERIDVVTSRGSLADHLESDRGGYTGATIGRYANRIAGGRFTLAGRRYRLATNDGPNHLHGGLIGFDQYVWDGEPFEEPTRCGVRLQLQRPHGDEGYPGAVGVEVTYALDDGDRLSIDYTATTTAPTIVSLTNHAYWNLAGGGSIADHELQVMASRYLEVDDTQIPIGSPRSVDGTRYDFREARRLGDSELEDGYDHCLLLDTPGVAAVLIDPGSGRRMTVATDQPGLQLYTANHLDQPHTAVCLEAQQLPDAPNRPDFPSPTLRPGEVYRQHTEHRFDLAPGPERPVAAGDERGP